LAVVFVHTDDRASSETGDHCLADLTPVMAAQPVAGVDVPEDVEEFESAHLPSTIGD
jgi:hypothetical protein